MATLQEIRKRITSVKNTQKITRAMKLVAAARLRKAQTAITAARPYTVALEQIIAEVSARAGSEAHPLLQQRDIKKAEVVSITSDRGLAGPFNANINKATESFLRTHKGTYEEIGIAMVGKKGREYFKRREGNIIRTYQAPTSATAHELSGEISQTAVSRFLDGETDAVFVIYNEFKSAIAQEVRVEQVLPILPKELPEDATPTDHIYEPSRGEVLDSVLPQYVEVEIYRALLESVASEFGARMSAMENSTNNANDMIGKLTLQYNRARQATITKELLEIIGGAEALKG